MAPKRKRQSELVSAPDNEPAPTHTSAYDATVAAYSQEWSKLTELLEIKRSTTPTEEALQDTAPLVQAALAMLPSTLAQDVVLAIKDQLLQASVFSLVRDVAEPASFTQLFDMLDVILLAASQGLCSDTLPHTLLEALFETEAVQNAERLFDFVESRSDALTAGLEPKKMKALIVLRFCNDLLRRLSKSTHTVFSGRILMFLANAFPIGDQSSVNLRGSYNTGNVTLLEGPKWAHEEEFVVEVDIKPDLDEMTQVIKEEPEPKDESEKEEGQTEMDVDQNEVEALTAKAVEVDPPKWETRVETRIVNEPDFYTLFWSLQQIFAFPPHLLNTEALFPFTPPAIQKSEPPPPAKPSKSSLSTRTAKETPPASPKGTPVPTAVSRPNLAFLRYAGEKIIARFSAANKQERELAGTSAGASKATNKHSDVEHIKDAYFFPKFLTSRSLLELQIADSFFRRQILVQHLILFQYLRGFSAVERLKWFKADNLNRTLVPNIIIDESEMKWMAELNSRVHLELRATPPEGEKFATTVQLILQREQHWIAWKISSCKDFVQQPLDATAVSEESKAKKKRLLQLARSNSWNMGNPTLSKLWNAGSGDVFDLSDLQHGQLEKDIHYFKAALENELALQEARKGAMTKDKAPTARQLLDDPEWAASEDRKFSLTWRALRTIAQEDLALFAKYDRKSDLVKLLQDIDKAKADAEEHAEKVKQAQTDSKKGSEVDTPTLPEEKPMTRDPSPAEEPDPSLPPEHTEGDATMLENEEERQAGEQEDLSINSSPAEPITIPDEDVAVYCSTEAQAIDQEAAREQEEEDARQDADDEAMAAAPDQRD